MLSRILAAAGAVSLWPALAFAQATDLCPAEAGGLPTLTLATAIERAREADLRSDVIAAGIAAARADTRIASFGPPDTIGLQTEDFPGTGGAGREVENTQITASYSRTWERGGKREARRAAAARGVEVAEADLTLTEAEIVYEVESLYLEAALAARRAEIACDRLVISSRIARSVRERVRAARDPELAASRARADVLSARADVLRNRRMAASLTAQLAAYWGETGDVTVATAFLDEEPAPSRALVGTVDEAPQLQRLDALEREAAALADLARAEGVPNVTWSVGARNFGFEDEFALVAGVSIPLGTGRRAEADYARATAERRRAAAATAAARQRLLREAVGYRQAAEDALLALEALETELLPEARRALDLAQDGYRRGAFSYLNVTDAQRSLTALREDRLGLLRAYYTNIAALHRLTAPGRDAAQAQEFVR